MYLKLSSKGGGLTVLPNPITGEEGLAIPSPRSPSLLSQLTPQFIILTLDREEANEMKLKGVCLIHFEEKSSTLLRPSRGTEYSDERVCLSVCLSVRTHTSGIACPNFTKFSLHVL